MVRPGDALLLERLNAARRRVALVATPESTVLKGIDHIVIVVADLDSAIASYGQLGFTVSRGGKHPIGTHNALIGFADGAYIELIAFLDRSVAHPWNAALAKSGGLVDFCLQTDDLARDIDAFRRAGVALGDPLPLTRERPDGYTLSWVLSNPPSSYSGVMPFLIRDNTPRGERIPPRRAHPNGAIAIRTITVAVEDAREIEEIFSAVLGRAGAGIEREDLCARGVRFSVGPHGIEFVAPIANAGPVAQWLCARGPSPYAAVLSAADGKARPLDLQLAQGGRLFLA